MGLLVCQGVRQHWGIWVVLRHMLVVAVVAVSPGGREEAV